MKYSALIGNPVQHSISPQLFDLLAKKLKIEYSHIKILIKNKKDLSAAIKSMCNLGFIGFNITCPYKIDTFNIIDDCDGEAKKIHSINSVVIRDNKMKGYNTDGKAAILSIKHFYDLNQNDRVVIIGAGGVAYPILYEILKITQNVVVFNENEEKAKQMCDLINNNVEYYSLDNKVQFLSKIKSASVIINATSAGMYPDINTTIIDNKMFEEIGNIDKKKCYFDVVFNPWETKLLKLAKQRKQITISGGYMLIYQAILVMELWLNRKIELSKLEIDNLAREMIEVLRREYD